MSVFFTLFCHFHPSASSTPSVRAHASPLEKRPLLQPQTTRRGYSSQAQQQQGDWPCNAKPSEREKRNVLKPAHQAVSKEEIQKQTNKKKMERAGASKRNPRKPKLNEPIGDKTKKNNHDVKGCMENNPHLWKHEQAVEPNEPGWRVLQVPRCHGDKDGDDGDEVHDAQQAEDVRPSVIRQDKLEEKVVGKEHSEENLCAQKF